MPPPVTKSQDNLPSSTQIDNSNVVSGAEYDQWGGARAVHYCSTVSNILHLATPHPVSNAKSLTEFEGESTESSGSSYRSL